jgi:isopentenyl phosphate kinase
VETKPNMAEVSGNLRIVHNGGSFGHFKYLNPKPVTNSSIYILFMEVICRFVSKENDILTEVLAWT